MSCDSLSKLCTSILREYFDETIAGVGENLMQYGVKTLKQICSSSNYSVKEVKKALSVLVQHNLVNFSDKRRQGLVDYFISKPNILNMVHYPAYINLVAGEQEGKQLPPSSASVWGIHTLSLLQGLFVHGRLNGSGAILEAYRYMRENHEESSNVEQLLKGLNALCSQHILETVSVNTSPDSDIPQFKSDEVKNWCPPPLNLGDIESAVLQDNIKDLKDDTYWQPNFQVLSQKLRDSIICVAAVRRVDDMAGRIVRSILDLCADLHDPWSPTTAHIGLPKISDRVRKDWSGLVTHLEQYLTILTADRTRFVDKVGDSGGGQYQVNYKHIFQEIANATIEQIILERFGSKSMRIFRYIMLKKYVEENQVQQVVMIPAKEAKLLTYQLMENNFICLQELRKTVGASSVPSKALYLFYINFDQVARYCVNLCLITIHNLKQRKEHELGESARLIDKRDKVEAILESVRQEGGTEEQLAEVAEMISPPEQEELARLTRRLDQIMLAQTNTQQSLFILQTCLRYRQS